MIVRQHNSLAAKPRRIAQDIAHRQPDMIGRAAVVREMEAARMVIQMRDPQLLDLGIGRFVKTMGKEGRRGRKAV